MIFKSLTATYGCLDNKELELGSGLNLITAPNEAGKSTWSSFIRTILYGMPTRERGALADKNRYAPWNGAAMKGRLDCEVDSRDITIIRDTVRATAPMGRFFASFDGTSEQVPWLDGSNCGETLVGVPREVYERSAFIRQSGLAIDQDAELERRIAALISSGEEDTSFTEAYSRLKTQLNKRRHNKTGALPRIESDIDALRDGIERVDALLDRTDADRRTLPEFEQQRTHCAEKLALHDKMDIIDAKRALHAARNEAEEAKSQAIEATAALSRDGVPSAEQLTKLKFSSANIVASQVAIHHTERQLEQAKQKTDAARNALVQTPFGFISVEDAHQKAEQDGKNYEALCAKRSPSTGVVVAAAIASAVIACIGLNVLPMLLGETLPWLAMLTPALSCGIAAAVGIIDIVVSLSARKRSGKANRADADKLLQYYNVSDISGLAAKAEEYAALYAEYESAKAEEDRLSSDLRARNDNCIGAADEIMAQVRLFSDDVQTINAAVGVIEAAIKRRRQAAVLEDIAAKKQLRYETIRESAVDDTPLTEAELALTRPRESRDELRAAAEELAVEIRATRSRIDAAEGQIAAVGDRATLCAQLENLNARRADLEGEYSALATAMEVLDDANAEMQSRFSPALGKHAGEIFSALTGQRYDKVLLDRELSVFAEQTGDATPRSSLLLSQGAADQLYLAVRLAICDLVLPEDKHVPLILDDALTNFDDARMERALEYLLKIAERRQILLFTCQKREKEYLQSRSNVSIISI